MGITWAMDAADLAVASRRSLADAGLSDVMVPQVRDRIPSTNGAFATGDGVKIGTAIGAVTVDMDKVRQAVRRDFPFLSGS
jgi:hypothetical protein